MTRRTRRNHTPAFNAQAALKSDKTLTELAQQYDMYPNQITDWKRQLTERAVQVFGDTSGPASSDPGAWWKKTFGAVSRASFPRCSLHRRASCKTRYSAEFFRASG